MTERRIVAVVADLMFGSRIRAAADAGGVALAFVRSAEALAEAAPGASLVLLDLEARWLTPDVIRALKADAVTSAVPLVAFVSHVRGELIQAARDAGADRVMARSAFVRELPHLVRGGSPS